MTELQHYNPGALAAVSPQPPAESGSVVSLREWAQAATAAHTVAQSLVQTSFVPEAFRGKPHEATAAILSGAEVGLSPMAALRSFDVIQGTAAPRALTLRAIVQSRGHSIWVVESTDQRAIVKGRRAGAPESEVQESRWDLARAKGLGLLGKHNWKAQQKAMLIARATAECCRLVAADAILGIPYAVEELDDGGQVEEVPKRTAQRRTTTRAKATIDRAAAPEPDLPDTAGEPALPNDEPEPTPPPAAPESDHISITKAQSAKLHAMFNEAAIGKEQREKRLQISAQLAKRPLQSSSDLTKDEASELIDTLEQLAKEGPLGEMIDALLGSNAGEESQLRDDDPDLIDEEES